MDAGEKGTGSTVVRPSLLYLYRRAKEVDDDWNQGSPLGLRFAAVNQSSNRTVPTLVRGVAN